MTQNESFSNSLYTDRMHLAECELSAFIAAVTKLLGADQARMSVEDWLDESEFMDPCGFQTTAVAERAAAQARLNQSHWRK